MKKQTIVNIIIILLAIAIGFAIRISRERGATPAPPPTPGPKPTSSHQQTVTNEVDVYKVKVQKNRAVLYPAGTEVRAGEDPKLFAVKALFTPSDEPNTINIMPRGTRLLSLSVKADTATVDLSREFKDNFAGGSEEEGLVIASILKTLKQFPDIKHVRLLIDGGTLDTLGHLDLSGTLDVNDAGTEFGGDN